MIGFETILFALAKIMKSRGVKLYKKAQEGKITMQEAKAKYEENTFNFAITKLQLFCDWLTIKLEQERIAEEEEYRKAQEESND